MRHTCRVWFVHRRMVSPSWYDPVHICYGMEWRHSDCILCTLWPYTRRESRGGGNKLSFKKVFMEWSFLVSAAMKLKLALFELCFVSQFNLSITSWPGNQFFPILYNSHSPLLNIILKLGFLSRAIFIYLAHTGSSWFQNSNNLTSARYGSFH